MFSESVKLETSAEMVCRNLFQVSARVFIPELIKQVMGDIDCQDTMHVEHPQCVNDPAVSSSSTYICSSVSWIC